MRRGRLRSAFTLVETIMVIVVLGIVSSIGAELIANVYKNYILQRATHRASLKTELAAQQIANLLSYRIPNTTLARNPTSLNDTVLVTDPTHIHDNIHILLEWIGTDSDGFSAALLPPWNGFCDVNASTQSRVVTPGSQLSLADTIMSSLSNGEVSLGGPQYPAIFFRDTIYSYDSASGNTVLYDVNACMGMTTSDRSCISSVGRSGDENLTFQYQGSPNKKLITEHYKLAWTAYSIFQVPNGKGLFDLKLCYNYQPWENERLTNSGSSPVCPGELSTIITNVSVFKFAESGSTFRFKICAQENIGEDYNVTICKEKAVIL